MNRRIVTAVAKVSFREFWRSPEALFWTYGFPLLMTVVLGFAFQPKEPEPVPVAVVAAEGSEPLRALLATSPRLAVQSLDEKAADDALARGRVGALVRGTVQDPVVRADPTRPDADLARLLVDRALARGNEPDRARFEPEDRPGSRYVDFLVPGLVGLNLLGAGMWGVGFQLVQFRTQNLLRRLFVTPMTRGEFLLGFLVSRLLLALPESLVIVLFGTLLWGVPFRGSIAGAAILLVCAALAFSGLGVLVASRAKTIEGVAGLMNVCILPMWLLGGAFFGNERMTGVLRFFADAMPLSWCTSGLRDLMLGSAGLADVALPVALLAGFAAVTYAIALRVFRWT